MYARSKIRKSTFQLCLHHTFEILLALPVPAEASLRSVFLLDPTVSGLNLGGPDQAQQGSGTTADDVQRVGGWVGAY